jgi:site-specific recombinase XerD
MFNFRSLKVMKIIDLADLYVRSSVLSPATVKTYCKIAAFFARSVDEDVFNINVEMVRMYRAKRLKNVSTATWNKDLRHLKRLWVFAIEEGLLENNPFKKMTAPAEKKEKIQCVTKHTMIFLN